MLCVGSFMRTLFDVPAHSDRGRGRARGDVCRLCLAAREAVEFTTGALPRHSFLAERLCHQPRASGSAPKVVMQLPGTIPDPVNPLRRGPGLLTCRPGPPLPPPRLEVLSGRPLLFGTELLFHHRRGTAISFVAGLLNCSAPFAMARSRSRPLWCPTAGPQIPLFQLQRQGRCPRGSASLVRVSLPCRQNNGAYPLQLLRAASCFAFAERLREQAPGGHAAPPMIEGRPVEADEIEVIE
jgi:hypothetical protein